MRDFIHVSDLAALSGGFRGFHAVNLGTGTGHLVREVVTAIRRMVI